MTKITTVVMKLPHLVTLGKNMKSCDQNDEAFWSHDYTKFKFRSIKRLAAFAIPAAMLTV